MFAMYPDDAFSVTTFAKEATRFVVNEFKFEIVISFRVPTLAVAAPRLVTVSDPTLRVVTFAMEAKRFVVKEFKFEIAMTFRVPTLARGVTT